MCILDLSYWQNSFVYKWFLYVLILTALSFLQKLCKIDLGRPGLNANVQTELKDREAEAIEYQLEDQVGYMLRRATQRHLTIFADNIPDLTPTQFAALAKLCELGRVSQNQLGRSISMDAATIKGVIDRLRIRELVETSPDEEDKRRLYIEATEQGQKLFATHEAAAKEITKRTLDPLSPQEQIVFLELLAKLA